MKKDLISSKDFTKDELIELFSLAKRLKKEGYNEVMRGKTLALVFEKPSLRTRVTFSVAMFQSGGSVVYLAPADIQLGKRESVADVGRNLSRWVDFVAARTFAHSTVMELAENASIPVINALSDLEHPCQAYGDFLTIEEKLGRVEGITLTFIGDGNNVANSLLLTAAILGANFRIASPAGYEINGKFLMEAQNIAKNTGAKIELFNDPFEAVKGTDVIYTDVWASMGQEAEAEKRKKVFSKFQVNRKLVEASDKDVIVMHCLPAHRGEEITSDILDASYSVVLDEAENRLHIQKAIMHYLG